MAIVRSYDNFLQVPWRNSARFVSVGQKWFLFIILRLLDRMDVNPVLILSQLRVFVRIAALH